MRILVTGATGFIGKRVVDALERRGHEVWRQYCFSKPISSHPRTIRIDFAEYQEEETWLNHLQTIDVVVNCVGIISERGKQSFDSVQRTAPVALFNACVHSGVKKIIQLSALGADSIATNPFLTSKRAADEYLIGLPISSTIIQPSIVYGPGEASMALLKSLAVLPIVPLINGGLTKISPIHVDDLAAAMAEEVDQPELTKTSKKIVAVGPKRYSLRQLLVILRVWMGYPLAMSWNIPDGLSRALGWVGSVIPGSRLCNAETIEMLARENINDVPENAVTTENARDLNEYLNQNPARVEDRIAAWRTWLVPFLRLSFALLWIGSAYVSIFEFPHRVSFEWLREIGIPSSLYSPTLYTASLLDFVLGIALLTGKKINLVLMLQIALMVCYTLIITAFLPGFWAHPFAPVLKNIPLLAATVTLFILEDDK